MWNWWEFQPLNTWYPTTSSSSTLHPSPLTQASHIQLLLSPYVPYLTPALRSPAVTPLRCITCHLRTKTDRCRRGFGVCVAQENETCMMLKIYRGKLEGPRCYEILSEFLGEYYSKFISQTKANPGVVPKCWMPLAWVSVHADRRGFGKMRQEGDGGNSIFPIKLIKLTLPRKTCCTSCSSSSRKRNEAALQRVEAVRDLRQTTPVGASDFYTSCLGPLGKSELGCHP